MEIFIYILSLFIPLFVSSTLSIFFPPVPLLHTIQLLVIVIGGMVLYLLLWILLISYKRIRPKALWRFTAEWGISAAYLLFHMIRNGISDNVVTMPRNFLNELWFYVNVRFAIMDYDIYVIFPWLYIAVSASMITLCLFFIIKHYKQTGKLW